MKLATTDSTQQLGQRLIGEMADAAVELRHWHKVLRDYRPDDTLPHESHAWLACILALQAVSQGNFGVGAVLIDEAGRVLEYGHNQVFFPYFRSDRHAEMVVLDRWEDARQASGPLTLVTSLEPCPMCLIRLSGSHVNDIYHVAEDEIGGMVSRMESLPPYWLPMARDKKFAAAACSTQLHDASLGIVKLNLDTLTGDVRHRR